MSKLRIGILSNSFATPLWFYEVCEEIQNSKFATIEALVLKESKKSNSKKSFFQKIKSNRKTLLYSAFYVIDKKLSKLVNHPFDNRDFRKVLPNTHVIYAKTKETKYRDTFSLETIEEIKNLNLDILICRGFKILSGDILKITPYGVWSYHHGDNLVNRGSPAVFWELYYRSKTIGTILQILSEDLDNGLILEKTITGNKSYSLSKGLYSVYWKSSRLLIRALNRVHQEGFDYIERKEKLRPVLSFYNHPLYKHPNNGTMFWFIFINSWRYFYHILISKLKSEKWEIGVKVKKDEPETSLWRYKKLPLSKMSCADPFILFKDNVYYLFYEEFHKNKDGVISCCGLDKKGKIVISPQVALKESFHLSYPCVFEDQGSVFLMPEASASKSVRIYKSHKFPFKFELAYEILKGKECYDPTMFIYENKYWLFCNYKERPEISSYEELFLFYSEKLEGPWISHPCNPIVSDVRNARPAGNLFFHKGNLYRPSQDCSVRYGYSINFNRVIILNEKKYKEEKVSEVLPLWEKGLKGTHTFNYTEDLGVVDFVK